MEILHSDTAALDVLVIGAGPHSLSLITRLALGGDADLLTEKQRSHVMSKAKYARSKAAVREHLKKTYDAQNLLPKTMVIDSHGTWMAQWAADFKAFGIDYLRSHQHMHCCPFDFQSLQVWAEEQGRGKELRAMKQVDREECRKAGYYGPFVVPSSSLFLDFCYSLVERFNLSPIVSRGTVENVRIMENGLFEVFLADGQVHIAKKVVCAIGPGPAFQGMRTTLPQWVDEIIHDTDRVQHSSSLSKGLLSRRVDERHMHGESPRYRRWTNCCAFVPRCTTFWSEVCHIVLQEMHREEDFRRRHEDCWGQTRLCTSTVLGLEGCKEEATIQ